MAEQSGLSPGWTISHFKVESLLGKGGMGEVFKGVDVTLGRPVALKVLGAEYLRDVERIRRFVQEAKSASALNHPNIVTIYEIGQATPEPPEGQDGTAAERDAIYYIAMEFIEGTTLRAKILEGEDPQALVNLMAQAADGLAKAHDAGIIHRDLKPDNIMVTVDGYAKVVDFGLAKLTEQATMASSSTDDALTQTGVVMGTAGYMSPEQIQAQGIDQRSDIFSFGCILYEVIAGVRPFRSNSSIDLMHKIVFSEPDPLLDLAPDAPPEVVDIVARCMAKDPDARYPSIRGVAEDLRSVIGGAPRMTPPTAGVMPRPGSGGHSSGGLRMPAATPPAAPPVVPIPRVEYELPKPKKRRARPRIGSWISRVIIVVAVFLAIFLWWTYPNFEEIGKNGLKVEEAVRLRDLTLTGATTTGEDYRWTQLGSIAPGVRKAVVVAEDAQFFNRKPFSVEGIKSSIARVFKEKDLSYLEEAPFSNSPISRSVARNLHVTRALGPLGSLQGFVFAYGIEQRLDKDQILEAYLNLALYPEETVGIDAASHRFFDKRPSKLTEEEAALLVAALEHPEESSPANPSEKLRQRQELILAGMKEH